MSERSIEIEYPPFVPSSMQLGDFSTETTLTGALFFSPKQTCDAFRVCVVLSYFPLSIYLQVV